ncbi:MAG: bifunctional diaminohydroxyphosphoribosylaminopyrimidine deaminase/5-amino-6-(5-phosphoribosylamino)uracil reductase RibD [Litoreibacter sp.]
MKNDQRFMALALGLASRGLGRTWPNPAVGCVIVKDDRIVGRGWTQPGGRPHAEPIALAQAGKAAAGATVYVTLEPCSHHGKTPPCAEALIRANVGRVVIAITDPDPRVSGRGIAMLEAAGVSVTTGILVDEATRANEGFLSRITTGRPFVTLKLASSFDGRIATQMGDSQWITGSRARRVVHAMRAQHDAVLVGGGTLRADDPSLTVRDMGINQQPLRVVISRDGALPEGCKLAQTAKEIPVLILHSLNAPVHPEQQGVTRIQVPMSGDVIDVRVALQELGKFGLTRVFCEGGGHLASSLLRAGLVDELVGFTAGVVIGGDGLPSIASLDVLNLKDAPRFTFDRIEKIDSDILHVWRC